MVVNLFGNRSSRAATQLVEQAERAFAGGDQEIARQLVGEAANLLEHADQADEAIALCEKHGMKQAAAGIAERCRHFEQAEKLYTEAGNLGAAARCALQQGDVQRAAERYELGGEWLKAAQLFERTQNLVKASNMYERGGQGIRAAELLAQTLQQGQRSPEENSDICRHAAMLFAQAGHLDKAIQLLYDGGQGRFAAGLMVQAGRHEEAIQIYCSLGDFQEAAKVAQDNGEQQRAQLLLAQGLEVAGKSAGAAEAYMAAGDFRTAATIYENSGDSYRAAEAYAHAGEHRRAATLYEALGYIDAAAQCLRFAGDEVAAAELIQRNRSRGAAVVRYIDEGDYLGAAVGILAHARAGDAARYQEALNCLKRIPQEHRDYFGAQTMLAEVLAELGQETQAIATLELLLARTQPNSENVPAYYQYGRLLEQTGSLAAAHKALSEVALVAPGYRDVEQCLARIEPGLTKPDPETPLILGSPERPPSRPLSSLHGITPIGEELTQAVDPDEDEPPFLLTEPLDFDEQPHEYAEQPIEYDEPALDFTEEPIEYDEAAMGFAEEPIEYDEPALDLPEEPAEFVEDSLEFVEEPLEYSQPPRELSEAVLDFSEDTPDLAGQAFSIPPPQAAPPPSPPAEVSLQAQLQSSVAPQKPSRRPMVTDLLAPAMAEAPAAPASAPNPVLSGPEALPPTPEEAAIIKARVEQIEEQGNWAEVSVMDLIDHELFALAQLPGVPEPELPSEHQTEPGRPPLRGPASDLSLPPMGKPALYPQSSNKTPVVPDFSQFAEPTRADPPRAAPAIRAEALEGVLLRHRFRIQKRVGRGAQAQVYLANDEVLDRPVAIKVLNESLAEDAAAQERFLREARLAARLHHQGCLAIYDFGQESGLTFMAMEYFKGRTVRDLLKKGPLDPYLALRIARDVASALTAVHGAGIVHRDVKPTNIMINQGAQIRVTDFGVACASDSQDTSGLMVGTMKYMAPEQARGKLADPRADVFSLGVMIFEMLAGEPPFGGTLDQLVERVAKPAPSLPESLKLSPEIHQLVARCLERKPQDRFESMEVLREEIQQIMTVLKKTRRAAQSA